MNLDFSLIIFNLIKEIKAHLFRVPIEFTETLVEYETNSKFCVLLVFTSNFSLHLVGRLCYEKNRCAERTV